MPHAAPLKKAHATKSKERYANIHGYMMINTKTAYVCGHAHAHTCTYVCVYKTGSETRRERRNRI